MSVAAPPRPPVVPTPGEPEALIEEARRRARRRRLVLSALIVALAGVGLWSALGRAGALPWSTGSNGGVAAALGEVSLEITVTEGVPGEETERRFTLSCDPVSGTLPFARRVCADIARHRQAMLRPAKQRSTCAGLFGGPVVEVRGRADGVPVAFGGAPWCSWPGGTPLAIYWGAAEADAKVLGAAEPRLRCDDDPAVLGPSSGTSRLACLHGLWTPRAARLIRIAKRVPVIAALPGYLFPERVGVRPCSLPIGHGRGRLAGLCGVSIEHNWSGPTVVFVEAWSGVRRGHTWRVAVRGSQALTTAENGPAPPQTWK